jgi:phage-related protein
MSTVVFTFSTFSFITDFGAEPQSLSYNPGSRGNPVVIPQRDGVNIVKIPRKESIPVNISGTISGTSHDALVAKTDILNKVMDTGRQQLKILSDRFLNAVMTSFDIDYRPGSGLRVLDFSVDFIGDEGVWQSATLDTTNATTDDTSVSITNNGTAKTPIKVTVTAPGGGLTAFTLKNATSDKTLTWSGSLSASQTLIIDTSEFSISENGLITATGFSGRFWSLDTGANTIEVTSTPTGATVAIEKRDRYR